MRVSVIGTIHESLGRATADALLAVLRHLQPEVLFLEMPPDALDEHMDGSRTNLESDAVRVYRNDRKVELVPVDLPTPAAELFAGIDEVGREVRSKSADYRRFKSWEHQYIEQHGFDFLNSSYGSQLSADIDGAIRAALTQLGDSRLSEHYETFSRTNELRDRAMLENIESYCASSPLSVGLLLVGSAHGRSLFEQSVARSNAPDYPVVWAFPGSV